MSLTATDFQQMFQHWAGCPPNGYLGSPYGSDLMRALQTPMAGHFIDQALEKLRTDIKVFGDLPSSTVNIYSQNRGADKVDVYIEIAGSFVLLDQGGAGVSQG